MWWYFSKLQSTPQMKATWAQLITCCLIIAIKKKKTVINTQIQNPALLCPANSKKRGEKVCGYDLKVKQSYGAPESSGNFSVNI